MVQAMHSQTLVGHISGAGHAEWLQDWPSPNSHLQVIMGELPLSFCSCRLQQTTYMMGLFDSAQYAGVITSSLEVVPESTPGKFRVIV